MRKFTATLALACAACLVAVVPLGGAAAPPELRGADSQDVTELFPQAIERIQKAKNKEFKKAVMLEVQGAPNGDQLASNAEGITRWRFVFDNQKAKGSKFLSGYLDYSAQDGFAKVKGVKSPFLEDRRMKNAPTMTLEEAVTLLRGAGYADDFANVTLRRPLLQDGVTPPLYIFGFDGNSYVAVDTRSGRVAPF